MDSLIARGISITSIPTTGPGTASEIVRHAIDQGADLILAAGGDGTINEVVNGMAHSEVPLGILPAGTANVLANELGLGRTLQRAADSLFDCTPQRIALGQLTTDSASRYFLLMAGAGLDADIVFHLNQKLKNALGKIAYWIGGLQKFGTRLPELTVEAEGRQMRVSFALASRVRNYGGDLEIAQSVSLLDDHLELVLFEGSNPFAYVKYMLGVLLRRHQKMRGVTFLNASKAAFCCPDNSRIHLQVDGEYAGLLPATIEIVPNALTLLIPADCRIRRPVPLADPAWTT